MFPDSVTCSFPDYKRHLLAAADDQIHGKTSGQECGCRLNQLDLMELAFSITFVLVHDILMLDCGWI